MNEDTRTRYVTVDGHTFIETYDPPDSEYPISIDLMPEVA